MNFRFWKKYFTLSVWKGIFPFSIEWLVIELVLAIICCFVYGIKTTIIYTCLFLSIFSDGLLIDYLRFLIFRKRYNTEYVKEAHGRAMICFIISFGLHSFTYYQIGKYSFIFVIPLFVLLAIIYLVYIYNKRKHG